MKKDTHKNPLINKINHIFLTNEYDSIFFKWNLSLHLNFSNSSRKVSSLRLSLEAQNTIVTAAEEAMVAEETPVVAGLRDETSDQEDVDRMCFSKNNINNNK